MTTVFDPLSFVEESHDETPPPQATEDEIADFKHQVSEWMKLDDQIRKLSIAIRERRTHQKAIGSSVQDFMRKHGYDNLNTQQGVIKSSVREARLPLKISEIKTQLFALENETLLVKDVISKLFEAERPKVVKASLRRVVPKVGSLDI